MSTFKLSNNCFDSQNVLTYLMPAVVHNDINFVIGQLGAIKPMTCCNFLYYLCVVPPIVWHSAQSVHLPHQNTCQTNNIRENETTILTEGKVLQEMQW